MTTSRTGGRSSTGRQALPGGHRDEPDSSEGLRAQRLTGLALTTERVGEWLRRAAGDYHTEAARAVFVRSGEPVGNELLMRLTDLLMTARTLALRACEACGGDGMVPADVGADRATCAACGGSGWRPKTRSIDDQYPMATGDRCQAPAGRPGDTFELARFVCSRPMGHEGSHAAHTGIDASDARVVATWGDVVEYPIGACLAEACDEIDAQSRCALRVGHAGDHVFRAAPTTHEACPCEVAGDCAGESCGCVCHRADAWPMTVGESTVGDPPPAVSQLTARCEFRDHTRRRRCAKSAGHTDGHTLIGDVAPDGRD